MKDTKDTRFEMRLNHRAKVAFHAVADAKGLSLAEDMKRAYIMQNRKALQNQLDQMTDAETALLSGSATETLVAQIEKDLESIGQAGREVDSDA